MVHNFLGGSARISNLGGFEVGDIIRGDGLNKTQRRERSANQAMDVAMQALERIEAHEQECGKRWAEAVFELKYLRDSTDAHAARWERLAWLVLGTFVATAIVHLTDFMM